MKISYRYPALVLAATFFAMLVACSSSPTRESTGQYLDDTAITSKVKAAIFNAPTLKSAEINVETFRGRVQLSGFVSSQADINTALTVTKSVNGVKSVRNDIQLK